MLCKECGSRLQKGQKKFCSKSCAVTYNNRLRKLSDETKLKISTTLKTKSTKHIKICPFCGTEFLSRKNKFCSSQCYQAYAKANRITTNTVTKQCEYCGQKFRGISQRRFCSNKCSTLFKQQRIIDAWLKGEYVINPNSKFPPSIKQYLLEKCSNKCQRCGFEGYNPITQNSILQVHHIDGDASNNIVDNLEIICPNCHAMTENYMALNKGKSKRDKRYGRS